MRVTIQLDQSDLERFQEALARAQRVAETAEENDILAGAKTALDSLPIGEAPEYVRKRLVQIQRLVLMLEDEAWSLPRELRGETLRTLVYFSDPEDMIPDQIAVIGLLDDAIMLEMLCRRQRHVVQAYDDFCHYRNELGPPPEGPEARIAHARQIARRRETLIARIRRHEQKAAAAAAATPEKPAEPEPESTG
jgi:uncharacterized membrane protein YkvA (DUF1232 family)